MSSSKYNRKLVTFERIIKSGFVNFFRNISLTIAATAVMTVTLTIILFSLIANATFNNTIQQINDKIIVSVYLKDNVNQQQTDKLINDLKNQGNVKSVEYISKQQALDQYRKDNQDNLELLLAISQTDNPLPATIKIKPIDPINLGGIKDLLESKDVKALQSNETSYSGDRKDAIDRITKATNFFKQAVFVSVIVFAVISVLIIFNTIQMAIFNRRDELQIMRLLGASTSFIKGPFIVETMIYGVVSAILSLLICNSLFVIQSQAFDASSLGLLDVKYASKYFSDNIWKFIGLQIIAGMMIGAISSYIATKKYLRYHPKRKHRL